EGVGRCAGEMADVEKPEAAELQTETGGARVLVRLLRLRRGSRASGGPSACARQRLVDRRSGGAHDDRLDIFERQTRARRRLEMPPLRANGGVAIEGRERSARCLLGCRQYRSEEHT